MEDNKKPWEKEFEAEQELNKKPWEKGFQPETSPTGNKKKKSRSLTIELGCWYIKINGKTVGFRWPIYFS